jgi:hypothetical protein
MKSTERHFFHYTERTILSQIYALFIEFYYTLFLFLFFNDMHYNTMIRTFCIMKKMTFTENFSLFWSLNLSEVILWCWNCMNDLMKSDIKMSSLNIAYYVKFMLCLLSFIILCFCFCFFIDMHYNTMIRTFCIMKKMTFTAFHYLNLSIRYQTRQVVRPWS